MTAMLMYVLPMVLGRTFDLATYRVGTDIFPPEELKKTQTIEHHVTDVRYQLVENSQEVRDFLDVEGQLSLNVKSGMVQVSGEGGYLKDSGSRDDSLEVIIKVSYETVTETLLTSARPLVDWTLIDAESLGTHFARSITYGGVLIASIRLILSDTHERETIKGALQGGFQSGGSFGLNVQGHLEKALKELQSSVSMEIDYYGSVPLLGVPRTVEGLMKLVKEFPSLAMNTNDGRGVPLWMEMYPLTSLSSTVRTYLQNSALTGHLDQLEAQFDDLRTTKKSMTEWLSIVHSELPPGLKKEVEDFSSKLEDLLQVFYVSIATLDVSVGGSSRPFDKAFDAYRDGTSSVPNKYLRLFRRLQEKVGEEVKELSLKPGGAIYTRWGNSNCMDNTVYSGVLVATGRRQGGSSQYFCLPNNPEYQQVGKGFPETLRSTTPFLVAPRYKGRLSSYAEKQDDPLACAVCHVFNRTSSLVMGGAVSCPEGWNEEYSGVLMAGSGGHITLYVCVDKSLTTGTVPTGLNTRLQSETSIMEVIAQCGSLPCNVYKSQTAMPCVVCSS